MIADPLAPLTELPGVPGAVTRARDAVVAVHNHPVNVRGWAGSAAEGGIRAARASAALDGAGLVVADGEEIGPELAGAVRLAENTARLVGVWRTSPLQALARMHVLAAADLVPAERREAELGRPRSDAGVAARLSTLAALVTGGTKAPAPVVAAVVHGELLALAPFGTADGVIARSASRLTAIAAGLDPHALAVPEVGHLRHRAEYVASASAFASGEPDGVGAWIVHCCAQWEAGADEALSIAKARAS